MDDYGTLHLQLTHHLHAPHTVPYAIPKWYKLGTNLNNHTQPLKEHSLYNLVDHIGRRPQFRLLANCANRYGQGAL